MERFTKLSRETQVVLAGTVLYLVFSFLDWQQISVMSITAGQSEWHGIGIVAGLLAVALLAWEAIRLLGVKLELGSISPGLVSVGAALLLLVFTVITFLSHNEARHWPAWIGFVLSVVIAGAGIVRARAEHVELPTRPQHPATPTGA